MERDTDTDRGADTDSRSLHSCRILYVCGWHSHDCSLVETISGTIGYNIMCVVSVRMHGSNKMHWTRLFIRAFVTQHNNCCESLPFGSMQIAHSHSHLNQIRKICYIIIIILSIGGSSSNSNSSNTTEKEKRITCIFVTHNKSISQ